MTHVHLQANGDLILQHPSHVWHYTQPYMRSIHKTGLWQAASHLLCSAQLRSHMQGSATGFQGDSPMPCSWMVCPVAGASMVEWGPVWHLRVPLIFPQCLHLYVTTGGLQGQGGSGRVRVGQGGSGRVREGLGGSGRVRQG